MFTINEVDYWLVLHQGSGQRWSGRAWGRAWWGDGRRRRQAGRRRGRRTAPSRAATPCPGVPLSRGLSLPAIATPLASVPRSRIRLQFVKVTSVIRLFFNYFPVYFKIIQGNDLTDMSDLMITKQTKIIFSFLIRPILITRS